jgi:LPXTG-site transpeptidase (sortase) family protein
MGRIAPRHQTAVLAAVTLVLGGVFVGARPAVHLVRRTHAAVTARSEWVLWVKSDKEGIGVGDPAGWITVESAGIDTIVLRGETKENLQKYPCLSPRAASFLQPGVVKVVAAHRDSHFRRLGDVAIGDRIRIGLQDGEVLIYRVRDMEVVPQEKAAMRVAEKDGADWLVLLTCYPFTFAGPAPDRFLVWARREMSEDLKTSPSVRPCCAQGAALPPSLLTPGTAG